MLPATDQSVPAATVDGVGGVGSIVHRPCNLQVASGEAQAAARLVARGSSSAGLIWLNSVERPAVHWPSTSTICVIPLVNKHLLILSNRPFAESLSTLMLVSWQLLPKAGLHTQPPHRVHRHTHASITAPDTSQSTTSVHHSIHIRYRLTLTRSPWTAQTHPVRPLLLTALCSPRFIWGPAGTLSHTSCLELLLKESFNLAASA
jgi:hypothetical protein